MHAAILLVCWLGAVAGFSNNGRIVNGSPGNIADFSYAAAMMYGWNNNPSYLACGCTIIGGRTSLTAANCVMNDLIVGRWSVLAGATSVGGREGVNYRVSQFILHPNFNRNTNDADIALVRVSAPFMSSSNVPLSIMPYAQANFVVPDHAELLAMGWGANEYMGPSTGQLQQVQLVKIPLNECREQYARLNRLISVNTICSGYVDAVTNGTTTIDDITQEETAPSGPRGHCHGDEGSPLIYENRVVGVYSWGYQCGLEHPSVNTLVSSYSIWIQVNSI